MLKKFGALLVILISASQILAQEGYRIAVNVKDFGEQFAYLAYYQNDNYSIIDTVDVRNESCVFEGQEKLKEGVYSVIFPSDMSFFDLVVNGNQHFELTTDRGNVVMAMQFEASPENEFYYDILNYSEEIALKVSKIEQENRLLMHTSESYRRNLLEIQALKSTVTEYKNQQLDRHPELLTSKLLGLDRDPEIPSSIDAADTLARFAYYRSHYFDFIDFSEPAIVGLPSFIQRIFTYYDHLTMQHPDSIAVAVDRVIKLSEVHEEVYFYVVVETLNKYANTSLMGAENVYVHILENYYLKGKTPWVSEENLEKFRWQVTNLKPSLLFSKAPDFKLKNVDGKRVTLSKIKKEFTLIVLWDYTNYDAAFMSDLEGVASQFSGRLHVVSVCTNSDLGAHKKALEATGLLFLENSDHIITPEQLSFFQLNYNYSGKGIKLLLLNKKKKIIAKNVSVEQVQMLFQ